MTIRPAKLRITAHSQAIILRALVDGPCTIQDLIDESGLNISAVYNYVRELRKHKLIYLVDKAPDRRGQKSLDIWRFGPDKRDTYRPTSAKERQKKCRENKKKREVHALLAGITQTGTLHLQAGCPASSGK